MSLIEVILLERIRGLGDIGDIVEVRGGFARNYLLPRKKVLRATSQNKLIFEKKRVILEQSNIEKKEKAEALAAKLAEVSIVILRQAGEDGRLYGSVTARDIVLAISNKIPNAELSPEHVVMPARLKEIGVYNICVAQHPDVVTCIQLNVARNEQEAEDALLRLNAEATSDNAVARDDA